MKWVKFGVSCAVPNNATDLGNGCRNRSEILDSDRGGLCAKSYSKVWQNSKPLQRYEFSSAEIRIAGGLNSTFLGNGCEISQNLRLRSCKHLRSTKLSKQRVNFGGFR